MAAGTSAVEKMSIASKLAPARNRRVRIATRLRHHRSGLPGFPTMPFVSLLRALTLSALLLATTASATAQRGDVLLLDGKPHTLHTNPLSGWLKSHPDVLPSGGVEMSSNWRGYVATWDVADDRLRLRKVEVSYEKGTEPGGSGKVLRPDVFDLVEVDVLRTLFPPGGPVVADWYSGTLVVPQGRLVAYVHLGYGSTYERYTILPVRGGVVVRRLDLTAEQFTQLKRERFAAYRKTAEYRQRFDEMARDGGAEGIEQFLYEIATEQYLGLEDDVAK
jgi:hypothetical protein